ncbi:MAG: 3-hydroxyacyl-CoA dehydrogenase NAD-binding domain-containing protein [Syntrophaceae bacterium]|nr:3-hydroxyacyl-CoA dehydrogenase NAD-binding domain-containing protein [Syntrophaceae bacterium]
MGKISKIGVVGAGNMGSGIAQKIAQEGLDVVMVDTGDELVKQGMDNIQRLLREGAERKIFPPDAIGPIMSRITGTTDLQALADADLVIEAVFEDKGVKTELFKKLDSICMEKTILATNTSSFYVREFAEITSRPDRVIGLHYFYHPAKNRLLEVIPQEKTSSQTIDRALLAAKLHGKTAILVKDTPGFAVNRFFVPFLNEAARMLEEGLANIPTIEEAAKRAFRTGMGPFELMNVTGLPITFHATVTLGNELGPFYATAGIMKSQMEKKTNWDLSGEVQEDQIAAAMDRFYGVCLGVAAALVDEGVATMEDTDRGAKVGLRWALGPFEIMNKLGIEKTFALVEKVADKYPGFRMPGLLARQRQSGRPFAFTLVNLAIHKDIATITINRPEAMNALNETVVEQLTERFTEAEQNPGVSAIVFQGAGKAFVAGADIRFFIEKIKAGKIADIVDFTRKGHQLFRRIEDSNKLTIALLDGLSMGGGSELALACQAIVATPAGSLSFPETGIGIYPGLGGMLRLGLHLGPELAKYYTFTGATITASDAKELGIVTRLVEPSAVDEAIRNLIREGRPDKYRPRPIPDRFTLWQTLFGAENTATILAAKIPPGVDEAVASKILKTVGNKAPLALKLVNQIIDRQAKTSRDEGIEIELDHLKVIFATADALEGLSSLGRKKPEYKGQ